MPPKVKSKVLKKKSTKSSNDDASLKGSIGGRSTGTMKRLESSSSRASRPRPAGDKAGRGRSATPSKGKGSRSTTPSGKKKSGKGRPKSKASKKKKKQVIEEEVDPLEGLIFPEETRMHEEILDQNTLHSELAKRKSLLQRETSTSCNGRIFEWLPTKVSMLPQGTLRGPETNGCRVVDDRFEERCIRRLWRRVRLRYAPCPLRDTDGKATRLQEVFSYLGGKGERMEGGFPRSERWKAVEDLLRKVFVSMPGGDIWTKRVNDSHENEVAFFQYSMEKGDIREAMELIISGSQLIHTPDRAGNLLLSVATSAGNIQMVRILLIHGSFTNAPGAFENTALHLAAAAGNVEIVELLLQYYADADAGNLYGETPLHFAARAGHAEVVELLLEKGADVDAGTNAQHTPLMFAAAGGHLAIVKTFVEIGGNFWARSSSLQSALLAAAKAKPLPHTDVVSYLMQKQKEGDLRPFSQLSGRPLTSKPKKGGKLAKGKKTTKGKSGKKMK